MIPMLAQNSLRFSLGLGLAGVLLTPFAQAWDYEGHRIVNQVALASLPADFPDFVRTPVNAERISWLCSEPDRWKSAPDMPARHCNNPDHYLDLEEIGDAGLDVASLSAFRYEFAVKYAAGRAAHAAEFPAIEPEKNPDRTREWPGFLPWTIAEYFGKLRGQFARLKVLENEKLGTPEEIAQTKASIVELMGVMGHYVGDTAQPLHTTKQHNGWVGPNPHHYTTWRGLHSWIDSGFIQKAGITYADLQGRIVPASLLPLPAHGASGDAFFNLAMDYVLAQHALVEPLYQLELAGKLNHDNQPAHPEGKAFIADRLLTGGQMLGRIWLTAWRSAAPDMYLRGQLLKKQNPPAAKP